MVSKSQPVSEFGRRCGSLRTLFLVGCLVGCPLSQARQTDGKPAAATAPAGAAGTDAPGIEPSLASASIDELLLAARDAFDEFDATTSARKRSAARARLSELVDTLSRRAPDNPRIPLFVARVLFWNGKLGEAQSVARNFARTAEGASDWRAHRLVADLLVNDFPQLALTSYSRALQLHPEEPTVLAGLSRCAERLGRREQAIEWAEQAVRLRSTAVVVGQLARAQANAERWDEAPATAARAISLAKEQIKAEPGEREPLDLLDRLLALAIEIENQHIRRSKPKVSADRYLRLADLVAAQADNARLLRDHDIQALLSEAVAAGESNVPDALARAYFEASLHIDKCNEARSALALLTGSGTDDEAKQEAVTRLRARCGDAASEPSTVDNQR